MKVNISIEIEILYLFIFHIKTAFKRGFNAEIDYMSNPRHKNDKEVLLLTKNLQKRLNSISG